MGKKIAIVGTTCSLMDAPYKDPDWEVWGLNGAYKAMPRWDRWFDLHNMEILKKHHDPAYFDFLANAKDKLMLNKEYSEYPDAEVFPYEALVDKYGRYFNNTVSWLIALAIEEQPEAIGLWGVNMAADEEYGKQRPSCEYYIGLARGLGIEFIIPDSSEICKAPYLYGVEEMPDVLKKVPDKIREVNLNYDDTIRELELKKAKLAHLGGYKHCMEEMSTDLMALKGTGKWKEKIGDFNRVKQRDIEDEALLLNREINKFADNKIFWEGARGMVNYFNQWRF